MEIPRWSLIVHHSLKSQALSRGLTLARRFLRRALLALAATDAARLLILAAAGAEEDRALMFYAERMAAKSVRRKG